MAEPTIRLAHLTAGRDQADTYVDAVGDVTDRAVTVDAQHVRSTTGSFTDQLVRRLAGAARVTVVGRDPDLRYWVTCAAERYGVAPKFVFNPGDTP